LLKQREIPAFRMGSDWRFNVEADRPLALAEDESFSRSGIAANNFLASSYGPAGARVAALIPKAERIVQIRRLLLGESCHCTVILPLCGPTQRQSPRMQARSFGTAVYAEIPIRKISEKERARYGRRSGNPDG
jgi:hypothetical protein